MKKQKVTLESMKFDFTAISRNKAKTIIGGNGYADDDPWVKYEGRWYKCGPDGNLYIPLDMPEIDNGDEQMDMEYLESITDIDLEVDEVIPIDYIDPIDNTDNNQEDNIDNNFDPDPDDVYDGDYYYDREEWPEPDINQDDIDRDRPQGDDGILVDQELETVAHNSPRYQLIDGVGMYMTSKVSGFVTYKNGFFSTSLNVFNGADAAGYANLEFTARAFVYENDSLIGSVKLDSTTGSLPQLEANQEYLGDARFNVDQFEGDISVKIMVTAGVNDPSMPGQAGTVIMDRTWRIQKN